MDFRAALAGFRETSALKSAFWVLVNEANILVERVEQSGAGIYVESGACHGYSSSWVSTTQVREIHTYDPVIRQKVWEVHPELKPLTNKIHFHNQRFEEGLPSYLAGLAGGTKIYGFIDGDHSTNGVANDFNAILPFLKPEDRLMFHDSHTQKAVVRFMDRVQVRFPAWVRADWKTKRGMTEFVVK